MGFEGNGRNWGRALGNVCLERWEKGLKRQQWERERGKGKGRDKGRGKGRGKGRKRRLGVESERRIENGFGDGGRRGCKRNGWKRLDGWECGGI